MQLILIIAMGLMYLANVLVIDAAGRDFYMRTKKIDTLSFVFIIIGLLFFAGSIIMHIPQELRIRSRGTERHSASN